ncbi:MAG: TonB-dependent receptor plug domain-containing protein [Alistipes sp.]|nr:TonB-dependent receptor plug domain-containing protein [Alistipes sp.]
MRQFILFCFIAMMSSVSVSAQQRSDDTPFNGMVIDAMGKGMARVNVWVKGTERRTMTDKNGRFGLLNMDEQDVLVFSRKDFRVEMPVADRKSLSIMIINQRIVAADECPALLNVGYGYVKRREYNSNYNVITGEELRQSANPDLESALMGRVPGMMRTDGELTLRGRNSINMSSKPLFVVDGAEVEDLSMVSIYDVETVTILKDGSMYGMRGANGVILVKTLGQ